MYGANITTRQNADVTRYRANITNRRSECVTVYSAYIKKDKKDKRVRCKTRILQVNQDSRKDN